MDTLTPAKLAGMIDHTLLRNDITDRDIVRLCEEAMEYKFVSVCVNGCFVTRAADLLSRTDSKVCSVVGFPLGCVPTPIKAAEAVCACDDGADELDMVINLPAALAGDFTFLARDIEAVLKVCRRGETPVLLKVILETAALPQQTKIDLCRLLSNLGVDFIKTSTGLHPAGGATVADVQLLSTHRGNCRIKAAGGLRTLDDCRRMIAAGAHRLGASRSVAIMKELTQA